MSGVDGQHPPIKYAAQVDVSAEYPPPGLICDALRDMYLSTPAARKRCWQTLVVEGRHLQ